MRIFRIADRVVVMRDGRLVGEKPMNETNPDELVSLIVGRSTVEFFHKADMRPRTGSRRCAGLGDPARGQSISTFVSASSWASSDCGARVRRKLAAPCSAPSLTPAQCLSMANSQTFLRRVRRCARTSAFWRAIGRRSPSTPR